MLLTIMIWSTDSIKMTFFAKTVEIARQNKQLSKSRKFEHTLQYSVLDKKNLPVLIKSRTFFWASPAPPTKQKKHEILWHSVLTFDQHLERVFCFVGGAGETQKHVRLLINICSEIVKKTEYCRVCWFWELSETMSILSCKGTLFFAVKMKKN